MFAWILNVCYFFQQESELPVLPNQDYENNDAFGPATKSVTLQRHGAGFGFTLRHFVVYPPDLVHKSSEVGNQAKPQRS